MAALIIESSNPDNLKLLASIAKKLGDKAKTISLTDMEDLFLGQMMTEVKTGIDVSESDIMNALGAK